MTELFTDTVLNMMTTTAEPEDYTGEDGLLYCGKCRTAKEAYFPKETAAWLGHDKHPTECDCQREKRLECESAEERRRHLDTVMELKRRGFTDLTMQEWTFAHDNGKCPQMNKAHLYVEHWEQMRENNYGLLLWGKVGTGKSYFAGCIANALMEQEISVRMTNFSAMLNDLTASFEGRNEYIEHLCRFPLLILDDFGMERGTEYGLEQVYNVIDSRYRSRKPLIVTTNLSLTELQNPQDTAHARIYDRVLEMCLPIQVRKELTDEWDARGIQKGVEYAILTDEISRAWSGMSTRQYKNFKGLKKENLRDNMTTLELVLNMLAEATTTEISKQKSPGTFSENLAVAREGGEAAGIARKAVEERTGVPVITSKNAAQLNQVVTDLLEGATVQSEKQDKEQ